MKIEPLPVPVKSENDISDENEDPNVDWATIEQLVYSRMAFLFSSERLQNAMKATRKPNANDWLKAAARKFSTDWEEIIDSPTEIFPLVALPEDLLKTIFKKYCPTRDKFAVGLVSQQFRRCVNWSKHYLTFDCSSTGIQGFTLNGTNFPQEKWPKLVKLLLEKTIITEFRVYFRNMPCAGNTAHWLNTVACVCEVRPDRFRLENVVMKGRGLKGVFDRWFMEKPEVFTHLRSIDIYRTEIPQSFSTALMGKPVEMMKLEAKTPFNAANLCDVIQSHCLHSLEIENPQKSLTSFIRAVSTLNLSNLRNFSYIGRRGVVRFESAPQVIRYLWQHSNLLQYCQFEINYNNMIMSNAEIANLIHEFFQSVQTYTKTTSPIVLRLTGKYASTIADSSAFELNPCQSTSVLEKLQEVEPESHLVDQRLQVVHVFEDDFIPTFSFQRGRAICTINSKNASVGSCNCNACCSDYILVLRALHRRLKAMQAEKKGVTPKKEDKKQSPTRRRLASFALNPCKTKLLVEDLRKTYDISLIHGEGELRNTRSYYYRIVLDGDTRSDILVARIPCVNLQCTVCPR